MRSILVAAFVSLAAPAFAQNLQDDAFCRGIAANGKLAYPDCMTMMGVSRYNAGQQAAPPSSHVVRDPVQIAPQGPTSCFTMPLAGGMWQTVCN